MTDITGTNKSDLLDASGCVAPTTLDGGNGNDTIIGSKYGDILYGGNGKDVLYGNWGDDKLYGGNGADFVYGGSGSDFIYGDDNASAGTDLSGNGPDVLYGDGKNASLSSSGQVVETAVDTNELGNDIIYRRQRHRNHLRRQWEHQSLGTRRQR